MWTMWLETKNPVTILLYHRGSLCSFEVRHLCATELEVGNWSLYFKSRSPWLVIILLATLPIRYCWFCSLVQFFLTQSTVDTFLNFSINWIDVLNFRNVNKFSIECSLCLLEILLRTPMPSARHVLQYSASWRKWWKF